MLQPLKNLAIAVALTAAVAAAAVASVGPGAFVRTAPYTLVNAIDHEPWCAAGDDDFVEDGPADLRGPHFALTVGCLFRSAAIPEYHESLNPRLRDMPLPEPGSEFLFAQIANRPDFHPGYEEDPYPVAAWIQVGEERLLLGEAPDGGDVLVLTAPVEETAVLWVEDEGRAQGLDLRTGEAVDPVGALYTGPEFTLRTVSGYEYEDVEFWGGRGGWSMSCSSGYTEMRRAAWIDDYGWAAEGSVLVQVQFEWCGSAFDDTEWILDTEEALEFKGGSERFEPVYTDVTGVTGSDGWELHTYVYEVPADIAEFSAFFRPVGELVEKESGDVFIQSETPEPTQWDANF